jgi:hypothetical protein
VIVGLCSAVVAITVGVAIAVGASDDRLICEVEVPSKCAVHKRSVQQTTCPGGSIIAQMLPGEQ